MNLHDVIRKPLVTEKSTIGREDAERRDLRRGSRTRTSTRSGARSRRCSRCRCSTSTPCGSRGRRAAWGDTWATGRNGRRRSCGWPKARRSSSSRECRGAAMPIRIYKPTSAGRRQRASWTTPISRASVRSAASSRGARRRPVGATPTATRRRGFQRRWTQAPVPADRLPARQGRHRRQGRGDRVRPEPLVAHRAAALRGRREALHPGARGPLRRRLGDVGPGGGHPPRQRAPAPEHSPRHGRPRGGAEAWQGARSSCARPAAERS